MFYISGYACLHYLFSLRNLQSYEIISIPPQKHKNSRQTRLTAIFCWSYLKNNSLGYRCSI